MTDDILEDEPVEEPTEPTEPTEPSEPIEPPTPEPPEPTENPEEPIEQISWDDWMNGYWVETISQYEPIVFLRIGKRHDRPSKEQSRGSTTIRVGYVEGDDGFTYIKTLPRFGAKEVLTPIYALRKPFG